MEEALNQANALDNNRREAGFNQTALDAAAKQGLLNGAFEDTADDAEHVLEEFYTEAPATLRAPTPTSAGYSNRRPKREQPTLHDLIKQRTRDMQDQQASPH